ncbi:MaoC family dehydratase [Candidatus Pelagibacter sp.]|nr:MaoC family dehydratase [Candidatus Pelagibacter sp.]
MFKKNQVFNHRLTKTITESDNNLFSLITMNHHPIHLNTYFAKRSQFKKILVNGTLVFSLSVGITVNDISFNAVANLEYSEIKHLAPLFLNDTINVKSKIISITKVSKKNYRVVEIQSETFNQKNLKVLSFKRKILIKY